MAIPFRFVSEYKFNTILAAQIKAQAMRAHCECGIFFRDEIGLDGAYQEAKRWGAAGIVELHFNAHSTEAAKGSETLFGKIIGSSELAKYIHAQIINVGIVRNKNTDRGLKEIEVGERGGGNVNNKTGVPSVLLEPFFGSNPEECVLALESMPEIALAVVNGFMLWMKNCVKDCRDVH